MIVWPGWLAVEEFHWTFTDVSVAKYFAPLAVMPLRISPWKFDCPAHPYVVLLCAQSSSHTLCIYPANSRATSFIPHVAEFKSISVQMACWRWWIPFHWGLTILYWKILICITVCVCVSLKWSQQMLPQVSLCFRILSSTIMRNTVLP